MEMIAAIVLGVVMSAFAIANGLISRWDDHEREQQRGKP